MSVPAKRPLKILLVEDSASARLLLQATVEREGHQALAAADGIEGLARFISDSPDLVITDVQMPRMDGFGLIEAIRKRPMDRWVPILMVTAVDSGESETAQAARAIDLGADDLLRKPLQIDILRSKIRAFERVLNLQSENLRQKNDLAIYQQRAEEERHFATELLQLMSRTGHAQDPLVRVWQKPAEQMSGDVVAHARSFDGRLQVMLADGTGHGLTAALNVLPLIEPFYAMTAKGYSVSTVATELNRKVHQQLPRECYVAAVLLSFDPVEGRLEVWNGGLPDVQLLQSNPALCRPFASHNPPLGVLKPAFFEPHIDHAVLDSAALLAVASDGLIEALGLNDLKAGSARLATLMARDMAPDALVASMQQRLDGSHPDDLTLVVVDCQTGIDTTGSTAKAAPTSGSLTYEGLPVGQQANWKLSLELGPREIADLDLVPILRDILKSLKLEVEPLNRASVVLTELMNNAVDHGVLGLSTVTKDSADDMERYFDLRDTRIAKLETGSVRLQISLEEGRYLQMMVADSGAGFDYQQLPQAPQNQSRGGRGLRIVRELCEDLEFRGTGNVVVARMALG